jgi:hypothetical protein
MNRTIPSNNHAPQNGHAQDTRGESHSSGKTRPWRVSLPQIFALFLVISLFTLSHQLHGEEPVMVEGVKTLNSLLDQCYQEVLKTEDGKHSVTVTIIPHDVFGDLLVKVADGELNMKGLFDVAEFHAKEKQNRWELAFPLAGTFSQDGSIARRDGLMQQPLHLPSEGSAMHARRNAKPSQMQQNPHEPAEADSMDDPACNPIGTKSHG